MQINRLLEIVYVLLRKNTVTAKELAERFSVSQRTIYRDIDTLSLSGIPVYTEKGKGGGISLLPDFVLNKSILSEAEQNEILSALHGLSSLKTTETDHVLQKLSAVFNKSAADWLDVDFSDWNYRNGGYFNDIKTAILERRIIEFDYFSTYGEKTSRRIEPIQIWFKSRSWYVNGFCLLRNDLRLFKLTRMKGLLVTDERFEERDLLTETPNREFEREQKSDIKLVLKIAPEMTFRVYDDFSDGMIDIQPDGSFIASAIFPEDDWIYGYIASFGEFVEVLEPKHVRENIKIKALKLAKNNS